MAKGDFRMRGLAGLAPALLACTLGLSFAPGAAANAIEAEAVLPPGNSGYVSIPGVATGTGSPHLSDQNQLFIDFQLRPFGFDQPGASETPKPGVTISRDTYGVPRVDANTDTNAWWGVGYAAGEDRLFQLELFKRAGNGTLAEILGSGYLDDDLIARRDYYTDAEMQKMINKIPAKLVARLDAYRDGINAYIGYLGTHPLEIPGEFIALNVPVKEMTTIDLARTGVLLARTVPSGDGNELENAQVLSEIGRKNFDFLHPVRTKGRISTVKAREGRFKAQPGRTRKQEKLGFKRTTRWLKSIDVAGAGGNGSTPQRAGTSGQIKEITTEEGEEPGADLQRIIPHGGSFMWAISDDRRGRGYLFNGPQLGFSIPELFYEFELHSPSQDVRGVSAAGLPVVGIGHNDKVAWGFTSGLSDEDDLYAEKLVDAETYMYKGEAKAMKCRNETFDYNAPPTDLPGLTDPSDISGSVTERICRTRHGPVQARGDGVAYARRYAIWNRELQTVVGLSKLNDAKNIDDVDKAMDRVTWNENVIATDSQGRIGYWHPGLHQLRPRKWDERLPYPGAGSAEWRGFLPKDKRPQVIDPKRDWVANWNNPPSRGWTNGDGPARERLAGNLHRIRLIDKLASRVARRPSYAKSRAIELTSGSTAQQFPFVNRKRLRHARKKAGKEPARRTIAKLLRWDGDYTKTNGDGNVHPGVAIWEEFKDQLETLMLSHHGGDAARPLAGEPGSSHQFDISNGEAIALREQRARSYARAAKRTAEVLSERFGSRKPVAWREPRRLYDVGAQGAGSAPELPFFDRGTWSQSLAMG